MKNVDVVNGFFAAWTDGDVAGAMDHCTDDVIWDNVPMKPIEGKAAVQGFLEKFGKGMSNVHYDIKHVLEEGNLLMLEGVENYEKRGRKVSVPYMASFEFKDGKICLWSDYFDLATVERQLA